MTRLFTFLGVAFLAFASLPAAAQTGVPMPSPMDVINLRKSDGASPCGNNTVENPVENEIEAAYDRAGRCGSYSVGDWNDYSVWVRGLDRREEPFGYEVTVDGRYVIGDYETVANYFNYHGIAWWDGQYSPGYNETARLAGRRPPGVASLYAGRGGGPNAAAGFSRSASPTSSGAMGGAAETGACGLPYGNEAQRAEQAILAKYGGCAKIGGAQVAMMPEAASRAGEADFADGGELGACDVPYLDQYGKEEQELVAEEGECEEYVAEIEAEGY